MKRTIINDNISMFREAARHTWNTYFRRHNFNDLLEVARHYNIIEGAFFDALVLQPIGRADLSGKLNITPLECIILEPLDGLLSMPIRFAVDQHDGNAYWSEVKSLRIEDSFQLQLIGFYEYNAYGHIDLSLAKVLYKPLKVSASDVPVTALVQVDVSNFIFLDDPTTC